MDESDMHVRKTGMSGSNSYQVCGLSSESNEGKR